LLDYRGGDKVLSIILMSLSILWLGSEIALSKCRRAREGDHKKDRRSLFVLWLAICISLPLGIMLGLGTAGSFSAWFREFAIAGIILIAMGIIIRWLAIFSLKRQFTVDVAITRGHKIVKEGIYRYVRHPSYSGSLLSFLGLGVFFANLFSILVIFVPIFLAFAYRIKVEEKALTEAFGKEYTDYMNVTKRLIPILY
jgi:protein-S-isoprenylcysteine O-methyltransferase Ste14